MNQREREITLRFLAEPADVNFGGKVHGGAVMRWIDLAAYACAAGWSGMYCITAYAGGIRFLKPILVGNIVEVTARIIYTGNSSMHLAIEVRAGAPTGQERLLTTNCVVIMVAVDGDGKPCKVPEWVPVTPLDIEMRDTAMRLVEMRKKINQEMRLTFDEQD